MLLENKGILLVLSGPAGSGKGTVVSHILSRDPAHYAFSVSATTRSPRVGEQDGVQYHFLTRDEFQQRIDTGAMLEYTNYCGNYYGTPRKEVEEQLHAGKNVILEIEVQGAMHVKEQFPEAVLVMVLPPDFATLESRLRGRHTNTEEDIQNRLQTARTELGLLAHYDYLLPNETGGSEQAAEQLMQIVAGERLRITRNGNLYQKFFGQS